MRRISLSEAEEHQLEHFYKNSPNKVVRERSFVLLLSHRGHSMVDIASVVQLSRQTISSLLSIWNNASDEDTLSSLSIARGRGAKVKLSQVRDLIPQLIEQHSRNISPILATLEEKHGIKICRNTLQNFLKGAGL